MSTREIISPSLLARIENLDTSKPQFSLGMSDWTDDSEENEDYQPPKNKMCKGLSHKVAAKNRCVESISDVEYAKIVELHCTHSTVMKRSACRVMFGLRLFTQILLTKGVW